MQPVQNNRPLFNPNSEMYTRPSTLLTKVRIVATAFFATLLFICLKKRSDRYLIVGIAVCLIAKHLYDQYIRKDPMMEAIYKIVGGKARFERLASKEFSADEPLLRQLNRKRYSLPIYRVEIADGRKGIIFQDRARGKPYVYIERLSARDCWFEIAEVANFAAEEEMRYTRTGFRAKECFEGVFSLSSENSIAQDYQEIRWDFRGELREDRINLFASISGDVANRLATQLQVHN